MKYIFFVFKHRFRKSALNNIIKKKTINNFSIIDLSGPLKFNFIGRVLLTLNNLNLISRNCAFVSCDAKPFIKKRGINIWFGGTSLKVPEKYQRFKNNFHVFQNFFKPEDNLINFAPTLIKKTPLKKNFKFVYISELKITKGKKTNLIWKKNKSKILKNFNLIEKKIFWKKNGLNNFKEIQRAYIELRNLIRLEIIIYLKKILKKELVVYGSSWKKYINDAKKSNYKTGFTKSIYNGNVCLDFGSKWASSTFYPRSVDIIESGGHLLQLRQSDCQLMIGKNYKDITFGSIADLSKIINNFKTFKSNIFFKVLEENSDRFVKLNYQSLKKIFLFSKNLNLS